MFSMGKIGLEFIFAECFQVSLASCPHRWSLLLIFGFLCWSSSWWWWPLKGVFRLLWPLLSLRVRSTLWPNFFLQNVFSMSHKAAKRFQGFLPLEKGLFPQPLGPAGVLRKLWNTLVFCWATPQNWGSTSNSIFGLQTPKGGRHPMLYFKFQTTEKCSICYARLFWHILVYDCGYILVHSSSIDPIVFKILLKLARKFDLRLNYEHYPE